MGESVNLENGMDTLSSKEGFNFDRETLHEAGHLWIACALGLPVTRFEINPEEGSGKTSISFGLLKGDKKMQEHSRELRLVANAGFAAEAAYWGLYSPLDSETDNEALDLDIIERIVPLFEKNMAQIKALAQRVYAKGNGITLRKKDIGKLQNEGLLPQPINSETRISLGL